MSADTKSDLHDHPNTPIHLASSTSSPRAGEAHLVLLGGAHDRVLALAANGPTRGNGPATPDQRSTEFRAVEGGPELTSGGTLLVEAYAALWLILLTFLLLGWRRQTRIDKRIGELEQALRSARNDQAKSAASS